MCICAIDVISIWTIGRALEAIEGGSHQIDIVPGVGRPRLLLTARDMQSGEWSTTINGTALAVIGGESKVEEDERKSEIQKRLGDKLDQNQQVLIMGAASHLASHILHKFMVSIPNSHITIQDWKDPNIVFNNPELREYKGSSRIYVKQTSPHDWEWLEAEKDRYNVIIHANYVHDAKYCNNNPIDSGFRNPLEGVGFMHALTKGSGWSSEGRLIILSTDKVYGPQAIMPTPETVPINPQGVRASTRAAQEMILTGMARAFGIHYICLRLGTHYGEFTARERAVNMWCRALLNGEPIHMNGQFAKDDSPSRDWIHVDDISAVTAYNSIADWPTDIRDEVYNIGGGEKEPHRLWNIAEGMKTVLRRGTQTIMDPWREPGEMHLRIWLDSGKAQKKLLLLPSVEFVYGITRRLAMWIAFRELLWGEQQIIDLKKQLGIRESDFTPGKPGEKGKVTAPVGSHA
jgi:nucleoside-diphosphate-sugar epimerase